MHRFKRRKSTISNISNSSDLQVSPSTTYPEPVQPGLEAHINTNVTLEVPLPSGPQTEEPGVEPIAAPDPVQPTLPSIWEQRFTSDLRPYYTNHATRTTSWTLPPGDLTESQVDLPPGWEMRVQAGPDGRRYFVNHARAMNTWDDPRWPEHMLAASRAADAAEGKIQGSERGLGSGDLHGSRFDLPPGWEMRVDNHGRCYYVDHNRGETTYDDPRRVRSTVPGGKVREGYVRRVNRLTGRVEFVDQNGKIFVPAADLKEGVGRREMRVMKLEE